MPIISRESHFSANEISDNQSPSHEKLANNRNSFLLDNVENIPSIDDSSESNSTPRQSTLNSPSILDESKSSRSATFGKVEIEKYAENLEIFCVKLSDCKKSTSKSKDLELDNIIFEEKNAKKLTVAIRKWQKHLPLEFKSKIQLSIWDDFEKKFSSANVFSVFLTKLLTGFTLEFTKPSFAWSRGFFFPKKQAFAVNRLLPVLVSLQNRPWLVTRIFCIAEDGLGRCHDRPSLAFVDMELEVLSDIQMSKICELFKQNEYLNEFDIACSQFISVEHQKILKLKTYSALINEFKNVKDGLYDPLQNVIISYNEIAEKTKLFPRAPYISSLSDVGKDDQINIRNNVVKSISDFDENQTKGQLKEHLITSDNWLKLLILKYPLLGDSLIKIKNQRIRYSENLVDLPEKEFIAHYSKDIQTLDAVYHRARLRLLNQSEIVEFTDRQIDYYCDHGLSFSPLRLHCRP
ncbi:hypothetical protein [Limnobacter sp.]|uniref:hypothetical protein n=1 Tax=Limnobacter sp. TaxID=2003368 RepID=UPI002FDF2EB6